MNRVQLSTAWNKRAACKGMDTNVFYPDPDTPDEEAEAAVAKAICASCSVREACLEYALAKREKEGIWGGMTERERRRILRQRRKSA